MKRSTIPIKVENYSFKALQKLNKMVVDQLNLLRAQEGLLIKPSLKPGIAVISTGKGFGENDTWIIFKVNKTRAVCTHEKTKKRYSIPFNMLKIK